MGKKKPPQKNRLRILIAEYASDNNEALSYRDIYEKTGVPINTLSSYVNQTAVRYDMVKVKALMDFFGIQSYDEFFVSEDDVEGNETTQQEIAQPEVA